MHYVVTQGESMLRKKQGNNKKRQTAGTGRYGQGKLRQSKRGVTSCFIAMGVVLILGVLIGFAYAMYGEGPLIIGSIATIALVLSVYGLVVGIQGFRERERNYLSCKFGIVANILMIVLFVLLFIRGLI